MIPPNADPSGGDPTGSDYLLWSTAQLENTARSAVAYAYAQGAEYASCTVRESGGLSIAAKDRDIESATRDGGQKLIVKVRSGGGAQAASEDLSPTAMRRTVDKAIAIAREIEIDDGPDWPEPRWLASSGAEVALFAPSHRDAWSLAEVAFEAEAEALAARGPATVRVLEAGAATRDTRWALASGPNFCRSASASSHAAWCTVIAERDGEMARDGWRTSGRRFEALMGARAIGERASERAMRKLGGRSLPTHRGPVLLDATVAGSLIGEFTNAIMGMAQVQRMTFLPDAVGIDAFPAHVDLIEDPLIAFGPGSSAFDGEGVAPGRRKIVDGGRIAGLLLGSYAARKLGLRSTGNADGATNLALTSRQTGPGDHRAAMLAKVGNGLWVTDILGGNVNPVTGDYSKAVAGFRIENGQVTGPVNNLTIAGNIRQMLLGISAIGADVHEESAYRTGSILIGDMQIAGQ